MEFFSLCKAFTLSVKDKYGNCTWERTYRKGFQMILKNLVANFPFLRMRELSYTYWFIIDSFHPFI